VLYKIVCGAYQLVDTGRIHPVRERALRALERSVDYIESVMPDALGLESQRDLIDYALQLVSIDGHYLETGVFTGGTFRYIARYRTADHPRVRQRACPRRGRVSASAASRSTYQRPFAARTGSGFLAVWR
jgi:hypothetical protein